MSFADEVREELCELPIKKPCCRRAMAAGLLLCAKETEHKQMLVRYRQEPVATVASALLHQQYGSVPESEMSGACGHRYYDLRFSAPSARKLLWRLRAEDANAEEILSLSCEGCRSAFLRGIFLACGTLNDPHRSFHLELLLPEGRGEGMLSRFLTWIGYPPRRIRRPSGIGLYFKESGCVEDLVALMGAQHTIFEIMNSRIEREIRNNENRATNCVAKNIEKTISAATKQMEAINRLLETGRLHSLPEGLQETAMLRYRNPDATLDELVALHVPPISKSGLNHRLSKLVQEGEKHAGGGNS